MPYYLIFQTEEVVAFILVFLLIDVITRGVGQFFVRLTRVRPKSSYRFCVNLKSLVLDGVSDYTLIDKRIMLVGFKA